MPRHDLSVLKSTAFDELDILRDLIREKAKPWPANLKFANFAREQGDSSLYGSLLGTELCAFGGNTFANVLRPEGPPYHKVVCDVAKRVKAPFNKGQPVDVIERSILRTLCEEESERLVERYANASPEQREEIIESLRQAGFGPETIAALRGQRGSAGTLAFQTIFRAGGFEAYKWALIVVNQGVKFLIGRGLPFLANTLLVKALWVFTGPWGFLASTAWSFSRPAYRVTVPCVRYIAVLRWAQEQSPGDLQGLLPSP